MIAFVTELLYTVGSFGWLPDSPPWRYSRSLLGSVNSAISVRLGEGLGQI